LIRNTAILLFIQEASLDASQKEFCKNAEVNKGIIEKFNSRIKSIAKSTGLAVFNSTDLLTNQNSFAESISVSIQKVFEKGFDKVICLGNDCPAISKKIILESAEHLQNSDTVLGPDDRGGVYLIGLSKSNFDAEKFKQIAWKSSRMLHSYLAFFKSESISLLERIADVHTYSDLINYKFSKSFISQIILLIKGISKPQFVQEFCFKNTNIFLPLPLRAPPVL
jgi:glycosyltransferase A (GT-A) superfamily protein (DUF2064 family)